MPDVSPGLVVGAIAIGMLFLVAYLTHDKTRRRDGGGDGGVGYYDRNHGGDSGDGGGDGGGD